MAVLLGSISAPAAAATIYVKILVDEEEVTVPQVWQRRLRQRLEDASEIIHQYSDVQFAVSGFGTWRSDNRLSNLSHSLREFEQEVQPAPAQIAVGFSSQYQFRKGVNGLGGTRGPMHTHILLREGAPRILEAERLEALVHELGHFLGAAHSRDPSSVMRPVIGDGQARAGAYRIRFDEHNARIIRLVGSEISYLRVRRFTQLSPETRRRVRGDYATLAQQLPKDPAAQKFLRLLDHTPTSRRPVTVLPGTAK